MLVEASAASCWVVGSPTAAAVPLSLSARRDNERASRSSAVTAFAEGGSGSSASSSPTLPIVLGHKLFRKGIVSRDNLRAAPDRFVVEAAHFEVIDAVRDAHVISSA